MWTQIRRASIAAVVLALGVSGLSFALTSNDVSVETETPQQQSEEIETVSVEPEDDTTSDEVGDTEVAPPEAVDPTEPTDPPETDDAVVHGTERSTEGCPDGETYKNHGQYVSGTEKGSRKEAAHSDCGKPVNASKDDGESDGVEEPDEVDDANDEQTKDVVDEPSE